MRLTIGSIVRLYYDQDTFDEGKVCALNDQHVDVDFYDWIERWPISKLSAYELWYEAKTVFTPLEDGQIILDFHVHNCDKILTYKADSINV
jgi:hypothetical protein